MSKESKTETEREKVFFYIGESINQVKCILIQLLQLKMLYVVTISHRAQS